MSALLLAVAILLPTVSTFLCLRVALAGHGLAAIVERLGVSIVFALGGTSALFFVWRLAGAPLTFYPAAEMVLLVLLPVAIYFRGRDARSEGAPQATATRPRLPAITALLLGVAIVVAVVILHDQGFEAQPHGAWDAWAIWNLRAAFLAHPSEHWVDGFSTVIGFSHPDYPLMVGASVARLWTFTGTLTPSAPIALSVLVVLATSLVMLGSLMRLGGYVLGVLGLALLLTPEYVFYVTTQCADVPLAMFVVTAVALLSRSPGSTHLVLAGVAAGFAAWTKNEGLIPALAFPIALSIVTVLMRRGRDSYRVVGLVALGVLLALSLVVLFSLSVGASSDLLTGIRDTGPADKLKDAARHATLVGLLRDGAVAWGGWQWFSPTWVVMGWLTVGGIRFRVVPKAAIVGALTCAAILAAGYVVYVLTPYDMTWHVTTSWRRLIVQMWPTLVWAAVAGASSNFKEGVET